jgi:predicted acetyltransferase
MLRLTLPLGRELGLPRLLLTCDDNVGSIRTIEKSGGVLENKVHDAGMRCAKRRYWIDL